MEEEDETDLARVDSWLQSTVPSIPKGLAVVCLILNIFVPGSGTITGGLISCCCGRPRYNFRPAEIRCPTSLLVIGIGFAQLLSTVFMLVGWLWSIIWGILMVNLSGEEFRRTPTPPPDPRSVIHKLELPIGPSMRPTLEDERTPRGKRNFLRLVEKAMENKEQAMYGPPPTFPSTRSGLNSAKKGSGKHDPNYAKTSSSKKSLSFINDPAQSKEEGTPSGSVGSKYSIFGCFRGQDSNSLMHEKFIKMMRGGGSKDGGVPLILAEDSPTVTLLRVKGGEVLGVVYKFFTHWKGRALGTSKGRLRNAKVEDVEAQPAAPSTDDTNPLDSVIAVTDIEKKGQANNLSTVAEINNADQLNKAHYFEQSFEQTVPVEATGETEAKQLLVTSSSSSLISNELPILQPFASNGMPIDRKKKVNEKQHMGSTANLKRTMAKHRPVPTNNKVTVAAKALKKQTLENGKHIPLTKNKIGNKM